MPETIGVLGATGSTGTHFVKLALAEGYNVKALARTPSKIETKDDKLTVIQGTFDDESAMKQLLEGCDYVVCMAGFSYGKPSSYPKDMMLNLVKLITSLLTDRTKVFLYQAGAFSADKDGNMPFLMFLMKHTLARIMGIYPNVIDNEEVTKYLGSDECKDVTSIITRPGMLKEMDGAANKEAVLSESPESGALAFVDLAKCSLKALKDESAYGKNLFVAYK